MQALLSRRTLIVVLVALLLGATILYLARGPGREPSGPQSIALANNQVSDANMTAMGASASGVTDPGSTTAAGSQNPVDTPTTAADSKSEHHGKDKTTTTTVDGSGPGVPTTTPPTTGGAGPGGTTTVPPTTTPPTTTPPSTPPTTAPPITTPPTTAPPTTTTAPPTTTTTPGTGGTGGTGGAAGSMSISIDAWTCPKVVFYSVSGTSPVTAEVWATTDVGTSLLETVQLTPGSTLSHYKSVSASALQIQLQLVEPGTGRVLAQSAELGYPAGCP